MAQDKTKLKVGEIQVSGPGAEGGIRVKLLKCVTVLTPAQAKRVGAGLIRRAEKAGS